MTAIAAVLAATSTPLLAQDASVADPVLTTQSAPAASTPAPAAAPAPVMTSSPVVQQVPAMVDPVTGQASNSVVPAAAPAPTVPMATSTRASTRAPAAAMRAAPQAKAPAAQPDAIAAPAIVAPSADLDVAPAAMTPATALPDEAAVADPAEQPADHGLAWSLIGLLGLGGAAALVLRRRRLNRREALPVAFEPPKVAGAPAIIPAMTRDYPITRPVITPAMPAPAMAMASAAPAYAFASPRDFLPQVQAKPARDDRRVQVHGGSAALIPPGPLPRGAALAMLFDAMVKAQPDTDNPFITGKLRRRRVRMLMRKHDCRLKGEAVRPFDFRTYAPISRLAAEEGIGSQTVPA